ncbi:MAG TPA: Gfo/Idh/MocA family oxidoreductase [Fimbriimonadaceae bacterium]|nr:Gfo/Idh/MocA family oxidoreductase [Fimbriimonadaceae bacterium]
MARNKQTRRQFLATTTAAAVGVGLGLPASVLGRGKKQSSPSDKVVFGLIGCGGMGAANMRNFMKHDEVVVAALCDVDTARMTNDIKNVTDKYGKRPDIYHDYRKMIERKDIDAIIVGSPDHWHALNFIHCCEAGKDVYQEKPISHNITEAKAMMAAQKRYGVVSQVGTWQRSTREFTDALDYVRKGKLGKIGKCRAWIADTTRLGNQKPTTPPESLDYDFWVGPAEMRPYQQNKLHFNWRWILNTGGGLTTDWGVHMIDIALLGMCDGLDLPMPYEVSAHGGLWAFPDDERDAPDTIEALYKFPDWVLEWSVLRDHPGKPGHGTEFISEDGKTLRVWRGGWIILDPDGKEIPKEQAEPTNDHWSNFLECLKSREKPRSDLHSVGQTTITCHLSNAALFSGETVRWDKNTMEVVGNAGKDTSAYNREYRAPWVLPKV